MRIYEINDQVLDLARSEFTYLSDSAAKIVPILGDGRLMLEREPDQQFDVLAMDAFSGDSVPTHLVTVEAIRAYLRHMRPDGYLVFSITNHYLGLRQATAAAAGSPDTGTATFLHVRTSGLHLGGASWRLASRGVHRPCPPRHPPPREARPRPPRPRRPAARLARPTGSDIRDPKSSLRIRSSRPPPEPS